jgi:ribosome biogenesis protein Nip4
MSFKDEVTLKLSVLSPHSIINENYLTSHRERLFLFGVTFPSGPRPPPVRGF